MKYLHSFNQPPMRQSIGHNYRHSVPYHSICVHEKIIISHDEQENPEEKQKEEIIFIAVHLT